MRGKSGRILHNMVLPWHGLGSLYVPQDANLCLGYAFPGSQTRMLTITTNDNIIGQWCQSDTESWVTLSLQFFSTPVRQNPRVTGSCAGFSVRQILERKAWVWGWLLHTFLHGFLDDLCVGSECLQHLQNQLLCWNCHSNNRTHVTHHMTQQQQKNKHMFKILRSYTLLLQPPVLMYFWL